MKKLLICEVGKPATVEDGGDHNFVWARAERLFGKGGVRETDLFPGVTMFHHDDAENLGKPINRQVPSVNYSKQPTGKEAFVILPPVPVPPRGGRGINIISDHFLIAFENDEEDHIRKWRETMDISILCRLCGNPLAYIGAIYCGAGCAARAGA